MYLLKLLRDVLQNFDRLMVCQHINLSKYLKVLYINNSKNNLILDGSDHRACCAQNNVERSCLDWCRGEPLVAEDNKLCLLQYTKRIMSCFREGRGNI